MPCPTNSKSSGRIFGGNCTTTDGDVIVSYQGKRTAACAARKPLKALSGVERSAWLKLDRLGAVHTLHDLTALQSNRLEILEGECGGQYAIRINEQWRIRFEWPETSSGPAKVELVDAGSGGHMAPVAIHPGEHLAEELRARNISASELARRLKVPTNRVTGILNGQRAITADSALPRALLRNQRRVLAGPSKPV